jgi:hypothetical protein
VPLEVPEILEPGGSIFGIEGTSDYVALGKRHVEADKHSISKDSILCCGEIY